MLISPVMTEQKLDGPYRSSVEAVDAIRMSARRRKNGIFPGNGINGNPYEDNNRERNTLLSHQYYYVCPMSVVAYMILQYLIGMKSNLGDTNAEPLSSRVSYMYNGAGFAFVISVVQQIFRIIECRLQSLNTNSEGIYCTVMTVSAIAASSFILTVTLQWGGTCVDVLGVSSTAAQWAEWLVTVPLMVYMALAMEDKTALTTNDIIIILVFILAISFGFLLNFRDMPVALGYLMFILGCCSITVTIVLDRVTGKKLKAAMNDQDSTTNDFRRVLVKASKRRTLSRLFLIVFPLFPLTHILAQSQVFDRDNTFIAYALCSLIAKLLFASTVSDAHMSLSEGVNKLRLTAELTANEKRRQFLRYVFHEVRVPLNTISMGLIVMKDDHIKLSDASREAVDMMNGATNFMSDTLNDVLSMQKIEDGKMELVLKPFSMGSLIKGATIAVKGSADAKKIKISIQSELDLPMERGSYIGDRFRLEHVVVNFLSNAIKFSPEGSTITVSLTGKVVDSSQSSKALSSGSPETIKSKVCRVSGDIMRTVSFRTTNKPTVNQFRPHLSLIKGQEPSACNVVTLLVIDEGTGIAKGDLERLFTPYSQLQADVLQQGKGTGMGLVLAKEIITLHGGTTVVESELGKGSAFGFTIPFELLATHTADTTCVLPKLNPMRVNCELGANPMNGAELRLPSTSVERVSDSCRLKEVALGSTFFSAPLSSESEKACELSALRAKQKDANLKARRTFLIVDGEFYTLYDRFLLLSFRDIRLRLLLAATSVVVDHTLLYFWYLQCLVERS